MRPDAEVVDLVTVGWISADTTPPSRSPPRGPTLQSRLTGTCVGVEGRLVVLCVRGAALQGLDGWGFVPYTESLESALRDWRDDVLGR